MSGEPFGSRTEQKNKRQIGADKERLASRYLEAKGYEILAANYRCRQGELDIVARDGAELVFIEVKYRKNADCGGSMYAVSTQKMRNISYCARYYIYKEGISPDEPMRFDVIAMDGDELTHVQNAFEYIE